MKKIILLVLVGVISAILGTGYGISKSPSPEPIGAPPSPDSAEGATQYVSDKNGNELKCKGKYVKIDVKKLRGELPANPENAVDGYLYENFSCAKNKNGEETGDVAAKATKKGMTVVVTVPAVTE